MKFDTGKDLVEVQGMLVEKDALNIVDKLRAYDDNLDILYLSPDRADGEVNEAPYIIVEKCRDGYWRRVFEVWTLDEKVLERIYNADTTRHDLMAVMDGRVVDLKKERNQRFKEQLAESTDIYAHLLKNPTTSYSFPNADGQIVKMDDKFGVTHVDGKSVEKG